MNHLSTTADTLALIQRWEQHEWLRPLDTVFAQFLATQAPDAPPLLLLGAALASHQLGRGHPCLDLAQTLRDPSFALSLPPEGKTSADGNTLAESAPPPLPAEVLQGITLAQWQAALQHPILVADVTHQAASNNPLVQAQTRLYLRRFWQYEQSLMAAIEVRIQTPIPLPHEGLRNTLNALFAAPTISQPEPDWQKVACALAARSAFAIITGGPGTGKTTTVVKLLAVLQAMALASHAGRPLRIHLAAPTGKAAARLNASIADKVNQLPLASIPHGQAIRDAIPVKVSTLHRLLGARPHTRRFKHHADKPLIMDVLVIDEASMIDLEMMAAVMAALPPSARLILLGDKNQLSSVQAGAVLGQLCHRAEAGYYTAATTDWLAQIGIALPAHTQHAQGTALDQSVVMLRTSHRFGQNSGIGQLAQAVNAGAPASVRQVLSQNPHELTHITLAPNTHTPWRRLVVQGQPDRTAAQSDNTSAPAGYAHYLKVLQQQRPPLPATPEALNQWAAAVLKAHSQFQLLCAVRRGPWGVEKLNEQIAQWLHQEGLISAASGWYEGRPVLVTRNDAELGLMNGDIGITLRYPRDDGADMLRVAFPSSDPSSDGGDGIQWVQPSRLTAVETVYALTVHKSQGSEFKHTALIMPDQLSPVLTRELIYTGITRAQQWFTLIETGSAGVLDDAVTRQTLRVGGLVFP